MLQFAILFSDDIVYMHKCAISQITTKHTLSKPGVLGATAGFSLLVVQPNLCSQSGPKVV